MAVNWGDEVISFIEYLKAKKLDDGSKALTGSLSRELLYKYYFLKTKKSCFQFEKNFYPLLKSFCIFVLKDGEFNFVEENFKEFKRELGK